MAKADAPVGDKEKKKGGKMNSTIIAMIGAMIAGAVLAAVVMFMFFKPSAEVKPEVIAIPDSTKEGLPNYEMIKYENITVNPITTTKRAAVFMVSLSFKVKPIGSKEEFKAKEDAIREQITSYLGSKKVEFYANPQFREVIKKELKTRVGKEITNSEIMQVYITYSLLSM